MSVVLPGTVRRESASAFALGESSGSAAEAALTAVRTATVAARSSIVFMSFIFPFVRLSPLCSRPWIRRGRKNPSWILSWGEKGRGEAAVPGREEAQPMGGERLLHPNRTEDETPGPGVNRQH